jgi:aspartyl aminopeptidase
MRNDMACGSTIGPITATETGINAIDIGVATFAMHSIRELAGAKDAYLLSKVITAFYSR